MNFISRIKPIPRLILFFILYLLITKETLDKLIFLVIIISISCLIIKFCYESKRKTIILSFLSLVIFLPLSFPKEIQDIFLPSGYKYISISMISSLIFYLLNKDFSKSNFKAIVINFSSAIFAPATYISGPSATANEIINFKEFLIGISLNRPIKIIHETNKLKINDSFLQNAVCYG